MKNKGRSFEEAKNKKTLDFMERFARYDWTRRLQLPDYVLCGLVFLAGITISIPFARFLYEPNSVQVGYINKDKKSDLLIGGRLGEEVCFLQQEDGSYLSLYDLQQRANKSEKYLDPDNF